MGHLAPRERREAPGRADRLRLLGEGGGGDRGGTEPGPRTDAHALTLVELKVLQYELRDRIAVLKDSAERYVRTGRWNLRKERREQCHRAEVRLAEVERRIRTMEAAS